MIVFVYHRKNLIYLVGKDFIQYMDVKFIANFELIDIGKKLCAWKSTVSCENTVGTLPSDRKLCAVQMSDTGLQILVTGTMVNGKLDVDLRNGKISITPSSATFRIFQYSVSLMSFSSSPNTSP